MNNCTVTLSTKLLRRCKMMNEQQHQQQQPKSVKLLKAVFRVGFFVLVVQRIRNWTWLKPRPTFRTRLVSVAGHFTFLICVFELMLFRRKSMERWLPKIARFVKSIDPELMKDQIEPCAVSHCGENCSDHAKRLFRTWWTRTIPVAFVGKSMVYLLRSLVSRRKIVRPSFRDFIRSVFDTTRLLLLFFGSSGLPGAAFCLTKKLNLPTKRGTRMGMIACSLLGSMSVFLLSVESAARMVHSTWVSAFVFAALRAV